ncbi:transposase, partial [Burkholderia cenocepacia]|uniref:transposase n=1 Tax=Burkholderia cenocepacia TaxID=95486 RepID=UPI00209AC609
MEIEDALDKGEYVLCGAMPVDADMELEHLESVRRHLGGIADVYLARDDAASTVSIRLSGSISRDDAKVVDRRIQKFAHDHCSAGAILWRGWNNSWKWFVVGLDWHDLPPANRASWSLVKFVFGEKTNMKKRFTEQQIIGFLKEAEAGMPVKELCRKHGFSDASFYTWRAKFGGMEVSEARRLK